MSITLLHIQPSLPLRVVAYLPQVLLKALVCSPEQCPDAEAVSVFFISNPRLLKQRVQFLSDVRFHLVMAIALCAGGGELLRQGKIRRDRQQSKRHKEAIQEKV